MIVWTVVAIQESPVHSEYIVSVHVSEESAEIAVETIALDMPANFKLDIEPMEVEDLEQE